MDWERMVYTLLGTSTIRGFRSVGRNQSVNRIEIKRERQLRVVGKRNYLGIWCRSWPQKIWLSICFGGDKRVRDYYEGNTWNPTQQKKSKKQTFHWSKKEAGNEFDQLNFRCLDFLCPWVLGRSIPRLCTTPWRDGWTRSIFWIATSLQQQKIGFPWTK